MKLKKRTLGVVLVWILALPISIFGVLTIGVSTVHADVFTDEARFVQRMNADRAVSGLAPLIVVPRLVEIARGWSRTLEERSTSTTDCTLSHNQNLLELLRPASKVGENAGCGDATADALHEAFMNSPRHRDNILDPSFDAVGVGVVHRGSTVFVTVELIRTLPVVVSTVPVLPDAPVLVPVPATVLKNVANSGVRAAPAKPAARNAPKAAPKPASKTVPSKPSSKTASGAGSKSSGVASKPLLNAPNRLVAQRKKVVSQLVRPDLVSRALLGPRRRANSAVAPRSDSFSKT